MLLRVENETFLYEMAWLATMEQAMGCFLLFPDFSTGLATLILGLAFIKPPPFFLGHLIKVYNIIQVDLWSNRYMILQINSLKSFSISSLIFNLEVILKVILANWGHGHVGF